MDSVNQKKSLRAREHDFASEIIWELSEKPLTDEELMNIAEQHYETDFHAEVLGRREIDRLEDEGYISDNGKRYMATIKGRTAFNITIEDTDEDEEFADYLLNGGSYRNRTTYNS